MAVEVDEERSWAPAVEDDPAARLMVRGSTRSYAQLIIDTANMVRNGDGDPRRSSNVRYRPTSDSGHSYISMGIIIIM